MRPIHPAIESARVLGLSAGEIAQAVGVDEFTLEEWTQGEGPTAVHRRRLDMLDALVREIGDTMRPEVVSAWLRRPLPAYDGATPHAMILAGRSEALFTTLRALNQGLYS